MIYYAILPRSEELCHFGIKRRSGRYPYGSGERPYQDQEPAKAEIESAKAEKRAKRKETLKRIGQGVYKAAWTGISVSLKLVASSAITSATIAGLATAGFQFLQSPAAQQIMRSIGVAAGNFLWSNFAAPAANQAARSLDAEIGKAMSAIGSIEAADPSKLLEGTQYLEKIDWEKVASVVKAFT